MGTKAKAKATPPYITVTEEPAQTITVKCRSSEWRLTFPHPDPEYKNCASLWPSDGRPQDGTALDVFDLDSLAQAMAWMAVEMERRGFKR